MKKIVIFSLAAMAAIITSCSSADEFGESGKGEQGNVKVTLTASMPSASTRTTLTDGTGTGLTQTWKSGDGIKVINSSKSNDTQTFTTTSTTATGSFTGTLTNPADNDQLYALYPSSLSMTGTAATVDYSAQDGTLAGVASKAVMYSAGTYSTSKTDLGTFKNAGAILRLKLTFPSDVTIKKVALVANGLVNQNTLTLSGTGTATWGTATQGAMIATFGSPMTFSANSSTNVYMAALPQTGLKSVTAIAMTDDAIPVYYTCQLSAASVSFSANKVHTLNFTNMVNTDITYTGSESTEGIAPLDMDGDGSSEMVIAENFKWLQDDANLSSALNCKMVKNMTINSEVNWTPIGNSNKDDKYFMGTFDGNNKTVSGVNINGDYSYCGFFGNTKDATIKDLTVSGGTITTTTTDFSEVGGLIGQAKCSMGGGTSLIQNCKTKFTSIINNAPNGESTGGLIGLSHYLKIYGCSTEVGTIKGNYVGGIIGFFWPDDNTSKLSLMTSISNCGSIQGIGNYSKSGGLLGYATLPTFEMKGCISNNNEINAAASNGAIGTLVGQISDSGSTIDNCYWKNMTSPIVAIGGTTSDTPTNSSSVAAVSGFNTYISNMNTAATATSGYHFEAGTGDNLPTIVKNK